MDNLEKVEKLRERANVSYEEARQALEENNWDMLDSMVSLEKQGKVNAPKQSQYSTSYEQQEEYVSVKETVYDDKKKKGYNGSTLGDLVKKFFRICRDNSFCINRHDDLVFKLPVILLVIIVLWTWKVVLPLLVVGLFFNFRYSFEGKDNLKEANDIMKTAGEAAERVKKEFEKKKENENE